MNKEQILKIIKNLKENSPKRNFKQTIDLIINLKQIDLKKSEQKIDTFIVLKHSKGKLSKLCIFLDKQLESKAKGKFDKMINKEEFPAWNDKKQLKKLARSYDFFVAQANLMTQIAATFGKALGPIGKMPNPKAGCIISPDTNLDPLIKRLQNTIRLATKNETIIKVPIGNQEMKDEDIAENILEIYNYIIHSLPQNEANIKSVLVKYSMSPPLYIQGGIEDKKQEEEK